MAMKQQRSESECTRLQENATPIQILHNSCAHLMGPQQRPIGGICIGYLGVRVFNPQPVYKSVFSVGGIR